MCGIIGLVNSDSSSHVNQSLVDALTVLQHRGQDAAGIITISNNRLNLRKDNGTVADVFTQESVVNLRGNIGLGHVRYPTAGGSRSCEAQPLYTNFPFGIAIAHNGNLTNTDNLVQKMKSAHRHVNTDSDSEVLLNVFADELSRRQLTNITPDDIFDSVRIVMRKCKGAYAVIILINRIGMLAFRDPNGIRPLCYGMRKSATGIDYAVASESVAIDALDSQFKLERSVGAGEAIFISNRGELYTKTLNGYQDPSNVFAPCLFEYVYFARPDSILDGVQVYEARSRMGEKLALKILKVLGSDHDIDTVIPIPETSRTAALQCAHVLNRSYREGYVKNRYIARTFIMPGQEMRRKTVRLKLNTIKSEFLNKVVLVIDDSIVRGTTSYELIQMARDAGAKKVYFASAAPPVRHCNVYGIDIPTRAELVAHNRDEEDICTALGADKVFYNDLEDIEEAVRSLNPTVLHTFEASCFNGIYITPEVNAEYLQALEMKRGNGRHGAASPCLPPLSRTHSLTNNNHNNNNHHATMSSSYNNHTATTTGICSSSNIIYPTVLKSSSPTIIPSNTSISDFSAHVSTTGQGALVDSKDENVSVDGNHIHTHDDVLQWSNDDAVIRSNEHHRIGGNEYTSSSSPSSSTTISLRVAIQEAMSIAGMIVPQPPPYQLTSPPVSPHKALLPYPRTYEVNRYATASSTSSAKQQTTATRQSFNNALLEPDVMEPDQLLDDDADRSRSVGVIDHYSGGGGGADSRDGGGDDGSDDNGRPTVVSFSRPLSSPKKVQRGYFHAVDGQHHQFYDSGGSGSCEPLHNG